VVAGEIGEDGHPPVRLGLGFGHEHHACGEHPGVRLVGVPDLQEETDPPGELTPDRRRLLRAVGPGEEQPGRGAGRADDDPAFGPAVVGAGRRVLDQFEAEGVDEEPDRRVVLVDQQCHVSQMHPGTLGVGWPDGRLRDP
jgi:hypothetical protein